MCRRPDHAVCHQSFLDQNMTAARFVQQDEWRVESNRHRIEQPCSVLGRPVCLEVGGAIRQQSKRSSVPLVESVAGEALELVVDCLLYTSDAADDLLCVDLGGSRI